MKKFTSFMVISGLIILLSSCGVTTKHILGHRWKKGLGNLRYNGIEAISNLLTVSHYKQELSNLCAKITIKLKRRCNMH